MSAPPGVVLVVDDRADTRDLYALILSQAGFDCRTAADYDHARTYLADKTVDVVILDLLLPRLEDGLGLAWSIRGLANPPPIIAVSGASPERFPGGLFDRFMLKPIEPDVLIDAVRQALARRA